MAKGHFCTVPDPPRASPSSTPGSGGNAHLTTRGTTRPYQEPGRVATPNARPGDRALPCSRPPWARSSMNRLLNGDARTRRPRSGGRVPRFRLILEYDGGPFVGWQYQQNGPSVQQAIEKAIFRFCGRTGNGARLRPDRHRRACTWPGGARGSRPFIRLRYGARRHQFPSQDPRRSSFSTLRKWPMTSTHGSRRGNANTFIAFSIDPLRQPTSAVASGGCQFRSTRRGWRARRRFWSATMTSRPSARRCVRRKRRSRRWTR